MAELDQRIAEAGREQKVGQQSCPARMRASDATQQCADRARQLLHVVERDVLQHDAGRNRAEVDVAQRYRARCQAVERYLAYRRVDEPDFLEIGAERIGENAGEDLSADLRHRRRRGAHRCVGTNAAPADTDHENAIRPEVERGAGRRDLPHAAVTKELAVDRSGRKHERNRARSKKMRHAERRAHTDTLRALPEVDLAAGLAKRHRHPAPIAHCSDGERVQSAAVECRLHFSKGNRPFEEPGEGRIVEQACRPAVAPCRDERDEPAQAGGREVHGVRAIDIPRVKMAPHLAQALGGTRKVLRARGDSGRVDRACRSAGDDSEREGRAGGLPFGDRVQDAGLIGGTGTATREHDRELGSRRHAGC